jgi:hypothetical protein
MGKSNLVQKVGGTNTLLVPGSQKLGGPVPPVPTVVAPMKAAFRCQRQLRLRASVKLPDITYWPPLH